MNKYNKLLSNASAEVKSFMNSHTQSQQHDISWLSGISQRLGAASETSDVVAVEREIISIARALTDTGPMDDDFAPSFFSALDTLQRSRKKANG